MTTLDHQIRERLDCYEEFRNHDGHQLAGAIRAVLDACNRVENGAMDGGWNLVGHAFAEEFRSAIASSLDITQEATDG